MNHAAHEDWQAELRDAEAPTGARSLTRLLSPAQRRRLLELPNEMRALKVALCAKRQEWDDISAIVKEQKRVAKDAHEARVVSYLVDHSFFEASLHFRTTKGTIAGIAFRHGGLELIRAQRGKAA